MKQLLEKLTTLAAYTAAVCTIVILLVTSININCFNKGFYKTEYASLETAQSLGMTEKDLNKATDALLDYLQDRRDNIDVTVAVKGTETKAFNARESSHMVDVRNLYRFAMVLRNVAIILLVLSLVYMAVRLKSGMLTIFSINYMKTAILAAGVFAMLAGWAYVDFDAFWTTFHKLAFRNDLWLLNPATDLMINLFPAQFFSSMVFRIVGMFATGFIGLFVFCYLFLRHQLHKLHGELHHD